ncbi:hypothetical protein Tco_0447911 [Tanacetum coccineum]
MHHNLKEQIHHQLPQRTKCIYQDTKAKRIANPVTRPQSESCPKRNDSDPEQAQGVKDMPKNLALLVKVIKNSTKPTNNNLRTSSNSRNKTEDTTPSPVVQQTRIQCLYLQGIWPLCKGMQEAKAELRPTRITSAKNDDVQKAEHSVYWQDSGGLNLKNPILLTRSTIGTDENQVDQNAADVYDEHA